MTKTNFLKFPSTAKKGKKPYKPKMSVPVYKSFENIIKMNEKALKIIAKRV